MDKTIHEVNHIVVVGGGTSAWLTAGMLSNEFPQMKVTLVDKEVGNPVGVGEGTLLNFHRVMDRCGFEVSEWFWEVDAAPKAGILFPGWGKDKEAVWHPFYFKEVYDKNTSQFNLWTKHQDKDFKYWGTNFYDISINHDKVDPDTPEAYAFHIDAGKLVVYAQKKLEQRKNVRIIKSEVIEVLRDSETHNVTELKLNNGQSITADLYVDCTGFRSILGLNPDRVDLSGRLFCDTAIAGHVPYDNKEKEFHPYVISEQVEQGWIWNIPVQTRIGSGLVFNRTVTSIDEAKDAFVKYWDNRVSKENLKVIDWTPYYNRNPWNKNVVSIGLSAGFIEPLESTGVALIIVGIEHLVFALESRGYSESQVSYYNNTMGSYFEDSIDFVSMHYALPEREGKLWDWVRESFVKSEKQKFYERQLSRSDVKLPIKGTGHFFCSTNWICWLIQMGYTVGEAYDGLDKEQSFSELQRLVDAEMARATYSPTNIDYISGLKR